MRGGVRRLLRDPLLKRYAYIPAYLAVTVTTAALKFLSVSLLIRDLGAKEFARWSLLEPAVVTLSPLALLGTSFGLIKQISQDRLSPVGVTGRLLLTAQPAMAASSALVLLVSIRVGLAWPGPLFLALLLYVEATFLLFYSAYRAAGSIASFAVSSVVKVRWQGSNGARGDGGCCQAN